MKKYIPVDKWQILKGKGEGQCRSSHVSIQIIERGCNSLSTNLLVLVT